jgi:hypothetical protein
MGSKKPARLEKAAGWDAVYELKKPPLWWLLFLSLFPE